MAYQAVPLILSEESLERRFTRGEAIKPGTAIVVATADGEAMTLNRRPTWGESVSARYRTQYLIDVTDHVSNLKESLPSRDDVFTFQADIDVGWRVTDPREVVLRRVRDGLAVSRSHLLDMMLPVTRRFDQDEPERAEQALNDRLRGKQLALPEGITLFRVSVRLSRDKDTQGWVQEQVLKDRERQRLLDRFGVEAAQAHQDNALADIAQQGQLRREQERLTVMQAVHGGQDDLVLRHLAVHPDDTRFVLESVAASREADRQVQLRLVERMISEGMLQPADAEGLLARLAGLDVRPAIQPPPFSSPPALPGGPPPALPGGPPPALPGGPPPFSAPPSSVPPVTPYPPRQTEPTPQGEHVDADPSNVGGWRPVGRSAARPSAPRTIDEEEAMTVEVGESERWSDPAPYTDPSTVEPPLIDDDDEPGQGRGQGGANVAGWKKLRRPED